MFKMVIKILRILVGLLPVAWGIGCYLYKKKRKGEEFMSGLTTVLFLMGFCTCIATGIDAIFE